MRQIKFRAWMTGREKEPDWQAVRMVREVSLLEFFEFLEYAKSSKKDDGLKCVLMEWTGLKDKNGVDIYEGDVVRIAGYGDYIVEFPFIELYDADAEGDIEAIKGNIYENKELNNGF